MLLWVSYHRDPTGPERIGEFLFRAGPPFSVQALIKPEPPEELRTQLAELELHGPPADRILDECVLPLPGEGLVTIYGGFDARTRFLTLNITESARQFVTLTCHCQQRSEEPLRGMWRFQPVMMVRLSSGGMLELMVETDTP